MRISYYARSSSWRPARDGWSIDPTARCGDAVHARPARPARGLLLSTGSVVALSGGALPLDSLAVEARVLARVSLREAQHGESEGADALL